MINSGLMIKSLRDARWLFGVCLIGIISFVFIFSWAMKNMGLELLDFLGKFGFISKLFKASFGIEVADDVSLELLISVSYTHVATLSVLSAFVIATTSRWIAAEIEAGTADLLLALPVSRTEIYVNHTIVAVILTALLCFSPLVSIWLLKVRFEGTENINVWNYASVSVNFLALAGAIGGFSSLVSSLINYRFRAIGVVTSLLLVSMMLNFVEPFIPELSWIRFLNILAFFRPPDILRNGGILWAPVIVLTLFGAVCWTAGLLWFRKKDIPAS